MKVIKLVLIFGILAFLVISCSDSLSPNSSSRNSNGDSNAGHASITSIDTLWTLISNPKLTNDQKKRLLEFKESHEYKGTISNDSIAITVVEKHFARLEENAVSLLQKGKKLVLPLSKDSTVIATGRYVSKDDKKDIFVWKGSFQNPYNTNSLNFFAIVKLELGSSKDYMTGSIQASGDVYYPRGIHYWDYKTIGDGIVVIIRSRFIETHFSGSTNP